MKKKTISSPFAINMMIKKKLGANHLSTLLKEKFHQDINRSFVFSRRCNGTFHWRKCTIELKAKLTPKRRLVFVTILIWVNVSIFLRKCFIKAHVKWLSSIFLFTCFFSSKTHMLIISINRDYNNNIVCNGQLCFSTTKIVCM